MLQRLRARFRAPPGGSPTEVPIPVSAAVFAPSSLQIIMCRFENGKMEKAQMSVADTSYLAISHVWGESPQWQKVGGIDEDILVSEEKAKFLAKRMISIVATKWFWMDVLCVDQRDKAARVAVTQHIPTIFRFAERTIVIREGYGFRDCCVEAIGDVEKAKSEPGPTVRAPYYKSLIRHYEAVHEGQDFEDGVISRLWPLQEIMLSDTLQFVRCDYLESKKYESGDAEAQIRRVLFDLCFLSMDWSCYGGKDRSRSPINPKQRDDNEFIVAYLTCGIVTRSRTSTLPPHLPNTQDFATFTTSRRRTAMPRDFILAIMPQFSFYTVPEGAKSRTFTQLFVDCFDQLKATGTDFRVAPLVIGPVNGKFGIAMPTDRNVPEAVVFGDFAKLLLGNKLQRWEHPNGDIRLLPTRSYLVRVKTIINPTRKDAIRYIHRTMRGCKMGWAVADHADLEDQLRDPARYPHEAIFGWDDINILYALQERMTRAPILAAQYALAATLKFLFAQSVDHRKGGWEMEDIAFGLVGPDVILRAAALFSCGLGFNAFQWSKANVTPVIVELKGQEFLALVPKAMAESVNERLFFLMETERDWVNDFGRRFTLLTWTGPDFDTEAFTVCLFPPQVELIGWKLWKRWI